MFESSCQIVDDVFESIVVIRGQEAAVGIDPILSRTQDAVVLFKSFVRHHQGRRTGVTIERNLRVEARRSTPCTRALLQAFPGRRDYIFTFTLWWSGVSHFGTLVPTSRYALVVEPSPCLSV